MQECKRKVEREREKEKERADKSIKGRINFHANKKNNPLETARNGTTDRKLGPSIINDQFNAQENTWPKYTTGKGRGDPVK